MEPANHGIVALRATRQYYWEIVDSLDKIIERAESYPMHDPRRFAGKEVRVALAEYLQDCGGKNSILDCIDRLKSGGADLGCNPSRTLRNVITKNPTLFTLDEEDVLLVPRTVRAA